ncbi:MAG: GNAT family N-acetyltransferase, partial [Lachnospiraceae bacterium]|nr:GNAT family N-acetyltransferase [Lachnospiraceae bacterium]
GIGSLFDDHSGIGSIAVDSAYSGRGYGTRLAIFLTNECMRRGCPRPCIYCENGNDNAMHIYKKIGYVEQNRETVAIKN